MVKIFVGNLSSRTRSQDLRHRFEKFGEVRECDIVNNFAFIHMDTEEEANEAIAALHNTELDGVKINVERSHGRKVDRDGPGPMRSRFESSRRGRDYPERFRGPPPRGFMGNGGPPPPPGPRGDRYGPGGWDNGYGGPYGPPMRPVERGGYGYPPSGPDRAPERYPPEPVRREPRGPPPSRDMPPEHGYRGPPSREPLPPPPPRDYMPKEAPPPPRSRYDSYDSYGGSYERYREPAPSQPAPSRNSDYYDSYGSYSSGPSAAPSGYDYPEYRESRPPAAAPPSASYESGYDYGSYYDYGRDTRSSPAPPPGRQAYGYGRS